jgi:hypothetical protein
LAAKNRIRAFRRRGCVLVLQVASLSVVRWAAWHWRERDGVNEPEPLAACGADAASSLLASLPGSCRSLALGELVLEALPAPGLPWSGLQGLRRLALKARRGLENLLEFRV